LTTSKPPVAGGTAVYICHCGHNIAATVDVPALADALGEKPGVSMVRHYPYLCSRPGQELIRKDLRDGVAGRVVVAACSPRMHEATFRKAVEAEGLNPYLFTHVNVREQCSWVHSDMGAATSKAADLIGAGLARVRLQKALEGGKSEVTRALLVVGGGVSGLAAALLAAQMGIPVTLVEVLGHLGGHAREFGRSFPSGEPVRPWLEGIISTLTGSPHAEVLLESGVARVEGAPGAFEVSFDTPSGTKRGLFGAIIVATGFSPYDPASSPGGRPELGYGEDPAIVTQAGFEKFLNFPVEPDPNALAGRNVAFLQCVGSRDRTTGGGHCSRACCMVSVRQADMALKQGAASATVLYTDLRAYARGAEEAYERAARGGVLFCRGAASEIYKNGAERIVRFEDTLLGRAGELAADIVVLACGARPRPDATPTGRLFSLANGADGFYLEAHPKLKPTETPQECVYLAGACQGPKTIDEAVSSGRAAAVKAAARLLRGWLPVDPVVARIDAERCVSCGLCAANCPTGAIFERRAGLPRFVNTSLCRGCGACASACPSHAASLAHNLDVQILAELDCLVGIAPL